MKSILRHLTPLKLTALVVKSGLTFAALWFVSRGVDFAHLGEMLRHQDQALLAMAAVLILCQIALGGLRWQLIMQALAKDGAHTMPIMEAQRIYYISVFFSCCLPGTVGGDIIRAWLAKSDRMSLSLSIHSVIIDRVIALLALGLLVAATLPMYGISPLLVILLIGIGIFTSLWLVFKIDRPLKRFEHWPTVRWLLYFIGNLRLLLTRRIVFIISLIYSLAAHLSLCLSTWVLAMSLGIAITPWQCILLIPPVLLAIALPISIGGWGVREAGMVSMLSLAGVPQAAALMLSIQLGLMGILVSLPGGVLWLAYRKNKRSDERS